MSLYTGGVVERGETAHGKSTYRTFTYDRCFRIFIILHAVEPLPDHVLLPYSRLRSR